MTERHYPHPEPRLWSVRLALLLVPFVAGIGAAGLRTAAAAYLVSWWGWPEAVLIAVCLEVAELAFLLRFVWTRENGQADKLSALGMAMGLAASVAFSVLLAFVASERLSLFTRQTGQLAACLAAVGVNGITYLLGREVARYVVEHEAAQRKWAEGKLCWQNRRLARTERKRSERARREAKAKLPQSKRQRQEAMVALYRSKPRWPPSELCERLGASRSTVFADRRELVQAGRLVAVGDGYEAGEDEG